MSKLDIAAIRHDFPMLKRIVHGHPLVYLDSAATALKPTQVIDAISRFYTSEYGTVHRAVYQLAEVSTERYAAARRTVASFLQMPPTMDVIFTRGATESINLVAHCFGKAFLSPGDEVIISEIEHHANLVPWQMACEERGALLRVVPVDERGDFDLTAYQAMLSNRTKIVAVAHVSNALGSLFPVEQIVTLAHCYGAKVLIDGSQAVPHRPVDLSAIGADFYVFGGHKAYGPTGIGVLCANHSLLEAMPPYQGGGDMIDQVNFDHTTYASSPMKFEAGTPMIAEVIGLAAALDYLSAIGMENVYQHEQALLHYATKALSEIEGVIIIGTAPKKGGIIGFVVEGIHPFDIGTLLDFHGVAVRTGHHCAQTAMARFNVSATVRLSFGLYSTEQEIDLFIAALRAVLAKLR